MTTIAPSTTRTPAAPRQTTPNQATDLLEQLRGGLPGLSERWLPRAGELSDFFERWGTAWNTHDLDQLEALVTEDIVCEDPAMFGETAHGRQRVQSIRRAVLPRLPRRPTRRHRRAVPRAGGRRGWRCRGE